MKKIITLMLLGMFMFGACTEDMTDMPPQTADEDVQFEILKTDRLYAVKKPKKTEGPQYAVAVTDKLWAYEDTIRIKFLNGGPAIRAKVVEYGSEWQEYINLTFEYVDDNADADVKIGFDYDPYPYVSWVTVGTDCRGIPQDEPSINIVGRTDEYGEDLDDPYYEPFLRADVLRAYGAMLGLGFEHRSPDSPITFKNPSIALNRNRLIGHFGTDINTILDEIIALYTTDQTKYTDFDITSIMVLPMPSYLLQNPPNNYPSEGNFELSQTDKCFIAMLYPKTFKMEWVCDVYDPEDVANVSGQIYMDPYDNVYFRNTLGRVMKLDGQTGAITQIFTIPSQYTNFYYFSIAADGVDNFYFFQYSAYLSRHPNNHIYRWALDGSSSYTFPEQLANGLYPVYDGTLEVFDNGQVLHFAGLSATSTSAPAAGSCLVYDPATDTTIFITNIPYSAYDAAIANDDLVYALYHTSNKVVKIDPNTGSASSFTIMYEETDPANFGNPEFTPYYPSRAVVIAGHRDIVSLTFIRKGYFSISPQCTQSHSFLYDMCCPNSGTVRNLGRLPYYIYMYDQGRVLDCFDYNDIIGTRDGKTAYIVGYGTSGRHLFKITNFR
jgi:hypothetical protein